jgi:ribulose-phosphate 3-epimerase
MKISPSILDADFQNLQTELDSIAMADRIHLDVMDGHYVPNLSFGLPVLQGLKFPVEIEAHLMVNNPENFIDFFVQIGCQTITFHIENTGQKRALKLLKYIQQTGIKAGICIDGYTEADFLSDDILAVADQILVMSVKAGFGGQQFMEKACEKIQKIRARGFSREMEVDGGIDLDNAPKLKKAGADIVVSGSFIMKKNKEKRAEIIREFQAI